MGVCGQRHSSAALPLGKTRTHCIGGWVHPRAGLDRCGKSRPYRDLDRADRSESLHQLRYPGTYIYRFMCVSINFITGT
jgi:hypothetical protein